MNPVQKPADKIITQWMEITRLLRQQMSGSKKVCKINPVQMHALMIIKEHSGLTMKEFAGFQHVTSPSATSFINRLVRMKWVKRIADRKNRKLVRLTLTEEGSAYVLSSMKEHTRMMRDVFSLLAVQDQKELARILNNLRSTLASKKEKV